MADRIKIRNAVGTWVVRAGGAVVGESHSALEVTEGESAPVVYFPRSDIGMAFLEKTDSTTRCTFKGQATYYTVSTASGDIPDAAWSYEDPPEDFSAISGYLAFFTDRVTVEQL